MSKTHRRADGRLEVADNRAANEMHGCTRDDWCILVNGHQGDCNEDRELWPGPGEEYAPSDLPLWGFAAEDEPQ